MILANRKNWQIVFIILLHSPAAVVGEGALERKTELIQALLSSSGLENRIEGLPPLISSVLVRGTMAAGNPNGVALRLRQIVASTFRAKLIRDRIAVLLQERMTEEELLTVIGFFQSNLGRTIVALEKDASLAGGYKKMRGMSDQLKQQNRKSPHRAKLIEGIDAATQGSLIAVSLAENMRMGVGNSLLTAALRFDRSSRAGLKARVEASKFRLTGRVTQQIFTSYLYIFRGVSDDKLQAYLKFAREGAGATYYAAMSDGIRMALSQAFETTDQLLVKSFQTANNS